MDLLTRLEHALEDLVEGVFSRAFRTHLQPIELAKRLTREVESHRAVSVHATYVPNVYTVQLAPDTYQGFQSISGRLLAELEQYLREFTTERDYQTVGPIAVRLAESAEVKSGEMLVTTANDEAALPSAVQTPSVLRSYASPTARRPQPSLPDTSREATTLLTPPTALEVIEGDEIGRHIPLTDGLSLGRGMTNTIALADPGVSRNHAQVLYEDETWVLHDCGSTNGTYVNTRRITAHTLQIGEVITIGKTVLRVV